MKGEKGMEREREEEKRGLQPSSPHLYDEDLSQHVEGGLLFFFINVV